MKSPKDMTEAEKLKAIQEMRLPSSKILQLLSDRYQRAMDRLEQDSKNETAPADFVAFAKNKIREYADIKASIDSALAHYQK